ncbi:M23 family metallopeptidase [Lacinutrix salivirga]
MRSLLFFLLLFSSFCFSQAEYPQDYFRSPLDIPIVLSGTFGELRNNHFHAGLDIKTQQRTGKKVFSAANGYVSRIKIAHFGYGKALYITHPNGYVTVYGHLEKFSPKIEAYIKAKQYEKESFEIEVFPTMDELIVTKGEIVAYTGNTGSSGGPHLHYEIRDNAERPINPLLFGIDVEDTKKPLIASFYAYPLDEYSHVNKSNQKQKLRLISQPSGDFIIEDIKAFGRIGFGVSTTDRQNMAANKNGVYAIQSFFNGVPIFEIDFKRFSFDETKHLNRLIDFEHYKNHKHRIQKLYREPNNPLSLYKNVQEEGILTVEDSTSSVYKVRVKDFKDNDVWISINIKGQELDLKDIECEDKLVTDHYIFADQKTELKQDNITVSIPANSFYEDLYLDFEIKNDTVKIHQPTVPLTKYMTITYDLSRYKKEDKNQLYIAKLVGWNNFASYAWTKREGENLVCRTKDLGTYILATDTDNPTITPINFQNKKWLSKYRFLKLKIDDKTSGISNYRATINGKWILMEYDYKKKTLIYDFNDGVNTDTENKLKVIVTDNVGNNSTFEATFYRK